jgi:4'-phosphopantetheinyl transferase
MAAPGWLSGCLADVPSGEDWLGGAERRALAALRLDRRRSDWRLGRWTAKAAVGAWLSVAPERVQILAAPDGAPEAWLDGARASVSISLSHRAGQSLAVVAGAPSVVGCDLELIEPRSGAFVREWLTPVEQEMLSRRGEAERAQIANLVWTAKEAAAKVRREGLKLDLRHALVTPQDADGAGSVWQALRIDWADGRGATSGWWCAERGRVMAIVADPRPDPPEQLD